MRKVSNKKDQCTAPGISLFLSNYSLEIYLGFFWDSYGLCQIATVVLFASIIIITDPRELTLPANIGRVHLEDAETGESIIVDTCDEEIIENFHRAKEKEKTNFSEEKNGAARSSGRKYSSRIRN